MGPCIFCFKDSSIVSFSREHLIPESLGGSLILSSFVCKECNSKFGYEFDHKILKNPDIVRALEKLNLPHDRVQLINKNYKVIGLSETIEVEGRATTQGFQFPSQALPDGSVIHPEQDYKEPLLKSILRNQRLYQEGLTQEQIIDEYNKLVEAYENAPVGERIESSMLGVTLIKRSESFKVKLEPKSGGDVSRLVAKIAYEFGFLIAGRDFLLNQNVAEPLHNFILTGEKQPGIHILRISTDNSEYVPIHFISFQAYDFFTKVAVGFFGSIVYALIAPPLEKGTLNQFVEQSKCADAFGVEYQQNLEKGTLGFWALLPGDKVKYIGP